jgi:hypothetical protein
MQRGAIVSRKILQIAKTFEAELSPLLLRHVVDDPIAQVPSRHRCVERAVLQLINEVKKSVRLLFIAPRHRSIAINLSIELFEQVSAIRESECSISAWQGHLCDPVCGIGDFF